MPKINLFLTFIFVMACLAGVIADSMYRAKKTSEIISEALKQGRSTLEIDALRKMLR